MTPAIANLVAWSAQVALVAIVCAPLPRLLRLPAHVQYGFWRVVLALCVLLPLIQPWHSTIAAAAPAGVSGGAALARVVLVQRVPAPAHVAWPAVLLTSLLAGVVCRLAWVTIGWLILRRMLAAGDIVDDDTAGEIADLKSAIGVRADVRWSARVRQPATFGIRQPVVLLPESLRARAAPIRRAVVAHELLHVHRRDASMLLLEEIVRAATWFHPVMWWLVARVRLAREGVVDELTVLLTGARQTYLDALLLLADEAPLASSAFSRRRQLFYRVLLISREVRMTSRRFVAASAVLTLALAGTAWTATSAFPLQYTGSNESPALQGSGVVNISFTDADLPSVLRSFSHRFGKRVQVDSRVQGRVTLELTDVPWRTAFDTILAGHHLSSRIDETAIVVFPASDQNPPPAQAPPRDIYRNPPPPPPPAPQKVAWQSADAADAVRIGGQIKQPIKTRDVKPVYPEAARVANVQGVVIVEALINRQGDVEEVHVLRSIPVLDQAAIDAVTQWRFTPVLLNGEPVPVIMTLTINFTNGTPVSQTAAWQSADARNAVRLGGNIAPPVKTHDVKPAYPADAQAARIQGVVIVEALIGRDGSIEEVHVLRSIPTLDQAAVDAVSQWKFTPVLLNGEAVPVIMTTTVNFTLQ